MPPPQRLPKRVLLLAVVVIASLVHIEILINAQYAPEALLVRVYDTDGQPETEGQCFGDISSGVVNIKKKPLRALPSIFDYISRRTFTSNSEKGFYLLETGLKKYKGQYEIRIVCYSKNLNGVSYTIVNNENQKKCTLQNGGAFLVC